MALDINTFDIKGLPLPILAVAFRIPSDLSALAPDPQHRYYRDQRRDAHLVKDVLRSYDGVASGHERVHRVALNKAGHLLVTTRDAYPGDGPDFAAAIVGGLHRIRRDAPQFLDALVHEGVWHHVVPVCEELIRNVEHDVQQGDRIGRGVSDLGLQLRKSQQRFWGEAKRRFPDAPPVLLTHILEARRLLRNVYVNTDSSYVDDPFGRAMLFGYGIDIILRRLPEEDPELTRRVDDALLQADDFVNQAFFECEPADLEPRWEKVPKKLDELLLAQVAQDMRANRRNKQVWSSL